MPGLHPAGLLLRREPRAVRRVRRDPVHLGGEKGAGRAPDARDDACALHLRRGQKPSLRKKASPRPGDGVASPRGATVRPRGRPARGRAAASCRASACRSIEGGGASLRASPLGHGPGTGFQVVQLPRLERGTFGATIRRSNQLSYSCTRPGTARNLCATRPLGKGSGAEKSGTARGPSRRRSAAPRRPSRQRLPPVPKRRKPRAGRGFGSARGGSGPGRSRLSEGAW